VKNSPENFIMIREKKEREGWEGEGRRVRG
jgi:hypothetical protein